SRFIWAIWNSVSKSETALSPLTMTFTPRLRAYSTSRPSQESTSTLGMSAVASLAICIRSGMVNRGVLRGLRKTVTSTLSKLPAARRMTSKWPLVMGSKLPGHKAMLAMVLLRPPFHATGSTCAVGRRAEDKGNMGAAVLPPPDALQARRRGSQIVAGAVLHHYPRTRRQPWACLEQGQPLQR